MPNGVQVVLLPEAKFTLSVALRVLVKPCLYRNSNGPLMGCKQEHGPRTYRLFFVRASESPVCKSPHPAHDKNTAMLIAPTKACMMERATLFTNVISIIDITIVMAIVGKMNDINPPNSLHSNTSSIIGGVVCLVCGNLFCDFYALA
jgi:hypothetical protein